MKILYLNYPLPSDGLEQATFGDGATLAMYPIGGQPTAAEGGGALVGEVALVPLGADAAEAQGQRWRPPVWRPEDGSFAEW